MIRDKKFCITVAKILAYFSYNNKEIKDILINIV